MIHTKETQIERLKEYTTAGKRLPNTHTEKIRMIKLGFFPNKCSVCSICKWEEKPLSLHLDHIDGNPSNNLIENLRLLCPNCHSQTETYCGKNSKNLQMKKYIPKCLDCKKAVSTTWTQRCISCRNALQEKKTKWPKDEEFRLMILNRTTMEALAKELNVSSNAIRKHCKKLQIEY